MSLVLPNVRSDGSVDDAATVPVIIRHPRTGEPTGAIVEVQIAPTDDVYKMARACRRHELDPNTRKMTQTTDGVKLQKMLIAKYTKRWSGMHGSDNKPLPLTPAVLDALPEWVADQITEGIRGVTVDEPNAAEVSEAGFRESA